MIKKLLKASTALGLVTILSVSVMAAGSGSSDQKPAAEQTGGGVSETYKALNLFGDVFEQVRAKYVDQIDDKKLIEYALNGMLSSLDPHSNYMNAEETKAMSVQNSGEFGGLGIEVTLDNSVVKVVSPIDDTPAARAGVQAGDLIVEIDGKQVMGMTLNDAIDKMRGTAGTDITLTIVRKGEKQPLKIKMTRDIIKVQSVKYHVENGNIGYIRITTFNAQTSPGISKAFADIQKQTDGKLIGYVLDLRNNPGGLLDQAIAVADDFIEKGEIVSTRGRNADDIRRDNATPGDLAHGLPLVVLINGGSASASEIVAGALQDHKRGIIMGTQSFGKGSVQTIFDVPGGGSIKLTTARYFTPSGRSIQAKGITPDIIVERAKVVSETEMFSEVHEADLKGALKNPDAKDTGNAATPADGEDQKTVVIPPASNDDKSDKAGDKKGDDKKKDAKAKDDDTKSDYQLQRAIDVLQGITLYRGVDLPAPASAPAGDAKTPAK